MRYRRIAAALGALYFASPTIAGAQHPTPVVGIAFDSLGRVPLAGAFVTLAGAGRPTRSTTSDERGLFRFDSVAPGTYTIAMQHAVFDSIGISGASARVAIGDGRDTLRLSTPSFARIWSVACGAAPAPGSRDSGIVFGTLRSAETRRPVPNATVNVHWVDIALDKAAGVAQRPWEVDIRSDSAGDYSACDIPASTILRIGAATDTAHGNLASGVVDVVPNGRRVERLDLLLGARTRDSTSRASGFVEGMVTSDVDQPVADALVRIEGAPTTRTDSTGGFLLRNVPPGTQEVTVQSIGAAEVATLVDITPNDTARVAMRLRKVTTLAPVKVKATASQRFVVEGFEERKSKGVGYFEDSTEISKHGSLTSVFGAMPSVTVGQNRSTHGAVIFLPATNLNGTCRANIWIDGKRADAGRADQEQLNELGPDDIAAIEVYPRMLDTPAEYIIRNGNCGAVVVWTKRAFP